MNDQDILLRMAGALAAVCLLAYQPMVVLIGFLSWLVIGLALSQYQLKTGNGIGKWACMVWGCSYGMKKGRCPNCGKSLPLL